MTRDPHLDAPPSRRVTQRTADTVLRGWRRPLAADDVRAQFWVRHLRIGVALSMVTSALLALYALTVPGRPHPEIVAGLAITTFVASPLLLWLPMQRMAQDHRGRIFFYAWSVAVTLAIAGAAATDGGGSVLVTLFCLTLSYAAVAYPPAGVAALGTFMVVTDLAVTVAGHAATGHFVLDADVVLPVGVLAMFVVMATFTSRNQWESNEQQMLLARTLEIEATTDALTGCLNRRAFIQRLAAATRTGTGPSGEPERPRIGVCLIDLDGFKQVNDTLGHATGDVLLQAIARALRGSVRESDTVARLGGDEFVVLTTSPPPPEQLAERLRDAVAREGRPFGVTASVGVTIGAPGDGTHELLRRADRAMYQAKSAGGDRVV